MGPQKTLWLILTNWMLTLLSDSKFNFIVKSQECQSVNKISHKRQTLSSENCFFHSFLKLRKARKEERRKKEKGVFIRKSVTLCSLLDKNKHFSAPNCGFLFSTLVFPDNTLSACLPQVCTMTETLWFLGQWPQFLFFYNGKELKLIYI